MATLTVWKFDGPDKAQQALDLLVSLSKQRLVEVVDAAIVSWPADAKKPKTQHMTNLTGAAALDGAFWGMLLGWIFFTPFFGMAVGALAGALGGHFADYGIGKDFIESVRSKVTPGTSALFLLTGEVTRDKVAAGPKGAMDSCPPVVRLHPRGLVRFGVLWRAAGVDQCGSTPVLLQGRRDPNTHSRSLSRQGPPRRSQRNAADRPRFP
jgi:uncharacterized membrane protein